MWGSALGAVLFDERLGLAALAGAALIVAAIALTARYEGGAPEAVVSSTTIRRADPNEAVGSVGKPRKAA